VGTAAIARGGGTPADMAPERLRGSRPSCASDVFALGTLLYEMLHGERPRRASADTPAPPVALPSPPVALPSPPAALPAPPVALPAPPVALPAPLPALLARTLDEQPGARFADGRELLEALLSARRDLAWTAPATYCHACQ
jgi:serine/threonine-protein kinase